MRDGYGSTVRGSCIRWRCPFCAREWTYRATEVGRRSLRIVRDQHIRKVCM